MTDTVPWPFPGDTELDKVRRVARDHRGALQRIALPTCAPDSTTPPTDSAKIGSHPNAPDLDLDAELPAREMTDCLVGDAT